MPAYLHSALGTRFGMMILSPSSASTLIASAMIAYETKRRSLAYAESIYAVTTDPQLALSSAWSETETEPPVWKWAEQ